MPGKTEFQRVQPLNAQLFGLIYRLLGGGVVAEREITRRQQNVKGRLKLTADEGGGLGWGNHNNITEPYRGSGKLYRDATKSIRLLPGPHPQGDK